ncbi:methyl coenzyme M reductase system, component A2 [Methanosalsum natronophilum]|uniref:Methyl coenzyme M reductase system, component A2 n=1 Tax=Methanosalsum natronophilum TaxID=768733 RepID=A0A3R7VTH4_9EURY|nr:methyl coenzyme M reductase system, component A2 [Methanosalsum natronophilum]MCS3924015.1 methyl coenzyme M reductase system subunit A2 [Methanosalsum natronophilum]RQD85290.1 MAG: methyl coenzyme M reductase system, component A2 [Methanosalsum natronophilum]
MSLFIEINDLNLNFGETKVLKNINLTINEGEVVGILGKSGSGKTVLMHVLRGFEEYSDVSGEVIYHLAKCDSCDYIDAPSKTDEKCHLCSGVFKHFKADFVKLPLYDPLRRKITKRVAIMLQRTFALYGDEKVIANVTNALNEIGYTGSDTLSKAIDILDQVQLSHRITHVARDLSGGEKQRVVLARQLVKHPMLLLADEPTGTLDPNTSGIVHEIIMETVKEYNMTMIITSHWPDVISDISDKAIFLDDGKIIGQGKPEEVANDFLKYVGTVEKESRPSAGEPIIKVKNLSKKYISVNRGVVYAINDLSFEVKEGEIFGIAGVSGAGKTTTSKILIGNIQPTTGEVFVRVGEEWIDMKVPGPLNRGRANQYMGILHQEYGLYIQRSVIDNLTESIGLDLPYELAVKKAIDTLNATGFSKKKAENILSKLAEELSEGEKHRVALAQVLIREPNIVIMDEPTGTMDPITKNDVASSILNARDNMADTFIIVSHDMDFLENVCDRVALMRDGKIVDIGEPKKVLSQLTGKEKIEADKC